MSSTANWESLFRRSKFMEHALTSVAIDFDTGHGPDITKNAGAKYNTLEYARHLLDRVDRAYWSSSRNDSGFSKIVPQVFGSTNAYDTARDNLKTANEMIMLALAMQQSEKAKDQTQQIKQLQQEVHLLHIMIGKMKRQWDPYDSLGHEAVLPPPDLLEQDGSDEPAPVPKKDGESKQVFSKEKKMVYEPVSALEKSFTANFKSLKDSSIPPIQVSAILDIASERNTISDNWASGSNMWTASEVSKIEKPRPFLGRRGQQHKARSKMTLEWSPVGSEKWVTTDFYIVMDGESEVVMGREFVDFQGIFHDLDLDVSPFRLPGMKKSRAQKEQQLVKQEETKQANLDLHEQALIADRLERQSRMEASSVLSLSPTSSGTAVGQSVTSSGTATPSASASTPATGSSAGASIPSIGLQNAE